MKITERQWRTARSMRLIWVAVESKRNARKMRLFGCACCRRLGELLTEEKSRNAVEAGERFADGVIDKATLIVARKGGHEVVSRPGSTARTQAHVWAASAAEMVAHLTYQDTFRVASARASHAIELAHIRTARAEERAQVELLHDIFGNPFRPVSFSPDLRTDTAVALAGTMYDSRDFSAMPILADALQDAGCDSDDILTHCRGGVVHVRGCWVVDLILGKS